MSNAIGKKQSINFGFRGWMLIIYQFLAFFSFIVFTSFPMNILANFYGGAQKISTIYTVATLLGIVLQLILIRYIGKIKSIKAVGAILGIVGMLLALAIMLIPTSQLVLWQICFFFETLFLMMYSTLFLGILVGQWFPRRKGTVMGIATFAFPIGNGLLGTFIHSLFAKGHPDVFGAFLPYFVICVIGLLIGIIFVKDYPEQSGAFRDNDKSLTPEIAMAMFEQEIIAKKTSVWTLGHMLGNRDFWFMTIPLGAMLFGSVGIMSQSLSIISNFPELPFAKVMFGVMVVACFGSWLLGVLDTKFGTKKAIVISVTLMTLSGVLGSVGTAFTLLISLFFMSIFMGAASNFLVSAAAQYWRREDFSNVFACINPTANILQSIGPMSVAIMLNKMGYQIAFGVTAAIGVVSLILILLFSAKHVKEVDDKYRKVAGKTLDDALVGRK